MVHSLFWSNIAYPTICATPFKISSNSAQPTGTGVQCGASLFIGQTYNNDQFSKVTVAAINSNTNSFALLFTNGSTSAVSHYFYYCFGIAAGGGSAIGKRVAGALTILTSQTSAIGCSAGDTIELRRIQSGANVLLYAYRNGVLDNNIPINPFTDTSSTISGGFPGIDAQQSAAGVISLTNFIGGSPPTIHGTDSQWSTDTYATTYSTVGNCAVNSASPAACGSAASGVFVVPATVTAYTVNTTAVTGNSHIFLFPRTDNTGIPSAPTCTLPAITAEPVRSASVVGTSFTLTIASSGITCWDYFIVD